MSRDEAIDILGKPRKDEYLASTSMHFSYGFIQFPFCPHPRAYSFLIGYDGTGRVFTKQGPIQRSVLQ